MSDKILDIYYNQYLNSEYDFHGIKIIPKRSDDYIFWVVKNPNNLSFSRVILNDFVHGELVDFSKFVSSKDNREIYSKYWKRTTDLEMDIEPNKSNVFLNEKDQNELKKVLKSINKFNFDGLTSNIEFLDFSIDNSYGEEISVLFRVKFSNIIYNGEKIKDDDNEKLEGAIKEIFYYDEVLDYQYMLLQPFTNKIMSNPLLYDDYMYFLYDFKFFDSKGDVYPSGGVW